MALSAHLSISLPFSALEKVTTATRTRPSLCKVLNSGFNQAWKKQSPLHSSFVTRSRWEVTGVAKDAEQQEKNQGGRIWLPNVVVQNRREVFWTPRICSPFVHLFISFDLLLNSMWYGTGDNIFLPQESLS
ncbi:hypothetical protein GQ457_07G032270 [Hibiscus cannabinus]